MGEPSRPSPSAAVIGQRKKSGLLQKIVPWLITLACFAYLYSASSRAAAREGSSLVPYILHSFENVSWGRWLALMIPYCIFFFIVDSLVVWTVINWFNVKISYKDILPIRASAYILSLINEQVSKGAIAYYLNRRDGVPAWEVGSSMLFIIFCEFYNLLTWATIGAALQWSHLPEPFHVIPWVALAALIFWLFWLLLFAGKIAPGAKFRERPIFRSFRMAKPWQYVAVVALRSPPVIAGIIVYTLALRLFGGTVGFGEMAGYLPVVFFGAAAPGPMHGLAIAFWVLLFPDRPGQMTAFGLVMHNFFIFFNAGIGLLFLRRTTRELFPERQAITHGDKSAQHK